MNRVERKIREAIHSVIGDLSASEDDIRGIIDSGAQAHVLFNSSFLYRDKRSVKTTQSNQRLLIRLTTGKRKPAVDSVAVLDGASLKSHYKILSGKDISGAMSLREAISQELSSIGDLIFVLIGAVKELHPCSQPAKGQRVHELRLDPSLDAEVRRISPGIYALRRIIPLEDLLTRIDRDLNLEGGLPEPDRRETALAYDLLLDEAVTDVVVPTDQRVRPEDTVLGRITTSLWAKAEEYEKAFTKLQENPEEQHLLNEVLRIAYNFSTDVLPLISLFVSVCDLKPIIFWSTIDNQWQLYRAFAALPWSTLGRKEKLEEYQSIISEARNSAFHHVLPFDATLEVDVSNLDVRAKKVRLFSPYGRKQARGVLLKDQELADVFAEFSRAKQRPVSTAFWEANLAVMKSACTLAESVLATLVVIHEAKAELARAKS